MAARPEPRQQQERRAWQAPPARAQLPVALARRGKSKTSAPATSAAAARELARPPASGTHRPVKTRARAKPATCRLSRAERTAAPKPESAKAIAPGATGQPAFPGAFAARARRTRRPAATAAAKPGLVATTVLGTVSWVALAKVSAKQAQTKRGDATRVPKRYARATVLGERASSRPATSATIRQDRTSSVVVRISGSFAVPVASGSHVSHVMDHQDV